MALSAGAFKALQPLEYTKKFLDEGVRPDGRSAVQQRSESVQQEYVTSAHGSAAASVGGNSVVVTVKGVVTVPQEHAPAEGVVEFQVHMGPQCSPAFSSSSTPDEAFALAEVLGRVFVTSRALSLESLCIAEGTAVWALKVDVTITSLDGNPLTAAVKAAGKALASTALPPVVVGAGDRVFLAPPPAVVKAQHLTVVRTVVSLAGLPTACAFSRVGGHWLVDPTADEVAVGDATVQAVALPTPSTPLLALLTSAGSAPVSVEELSSCAASAMAGVGGE